MKRNLSFFSKILIISLVILFFSEPVFSLKKTSKKDTSNKISNSEKIDDISSISDNKNDTKSSPSILLPSNSNYKSFFYKIDEEIIKEMENGSPESIKSAMRKIHKSSEDYKENERVLVYIATTIMELVWPSESFSWVKIMPLEESSYTGAIDSVKNGIFDTSTGNSDFFNCLLPALVFLTNQNNSEVNLMCFQALNKALELNPDSALVKYLLGKFYLFNGEYSDAVSWLSQAYVSNESSFEIGVAYSEALNRTNNFQLSSNVVSKLAEKNPDNLEVLKRNAYIAFEQGNLVDAEDYVARILQQTPNDSEFVLFRAKIFIEKKDYIHAVSLLDMYAKQNDSSLNYLILRTRVLLDWSRNYNGATETIEKAVILYPNNTEVLMLAAQISSTTDAPVAGKYADELAEMVLRKNPNNVEALVYALDGLIQRENWNEAYEISSKLIQDENVSTDVILRHVKVCIKCQKGQEALTISTKAYNTNKSDENNIQSYVLAYVNRYSRDNSLILINSLMDTSTQKIKSFLYLQRSYLQRGEDAILADLRSSLIANPRNDAALFRLYEIYFARKDYRKAQYYLRQVVAIKPNDSTVKSLNESLTKLLK